MLLQAAKILLYLLSGVLVTPGFLLAVFLYVVGGMANSKSLVDAITFLLKKMAQAADWGIWLVLLAIIGWLVLAFIPKYRLVGSIGAAFVATGSLIVMFAIGSNSTQSDGWFVPALSLAGLLIAAGMIWWDAASW